jgi:hypothetical protein
MNMKKKIIGLLALMSLLALAPVNAQEKGAGPEGQKVKSGKEAGERPSPFVLPPDDQRETARLSDHCRGLENSFDCARAIERAQLPRYAQDVTRQDGNLKLTLKTGKTLVLKDTPGVSGMSYSFRDYLPNLGYFLVHVQLWEGEGYMLVNDRTGKKYHLDDLPIISPDRTRLVTLSYDLDARYNPNAIKVWRLSPEKLVLEYSLEPKDWGPAGGAWLDHQTVSLTKKIPMGEYHQDFRQVPMLLKKTPTGWQLTEK